MNLFGLLTIVVLEVVVTFLYAEPFDAKRDVNFLLRVKKRELEDEEVSLLETRNDIGASAFDPARPTTFLVHGYTEDRRVRHYSELSRAILETSDQNLFFVDWGKGAQTFPYQIARSRVVEVAKVLGSFINFLQQNANLNLANVTLIGFSLGAHVCGLAGKNFVDGKVEKIIGLDPAGPLFDFKDPDNRLSPESATYTECIHTGYKFGIREPICHVDFYVNGGANQPGCEIVFLFDSILCSHSRAVHVYIESLSFPGAFYGDRCESLDNALNKDCKGKAGAFINNPNNKAKKVSGIFHVHTNAESPFGRGPESHD